MLAPIPTVIYLLCVGSSGLCAALLLRAYSRNRIALLLWSAVCFIFLALNNLAVLVDFILPPTIDLTMVRLVLSLIGILTLLYGFIWEVD